MQSECRNCSNVSLDVRLDDKLLGIGEKRENTATGAASPWVEAQAALSGHFALVWDGGAAK